MYDTNIVILVGRLIKDAELSQTQSGKTMCKFCIASNKGKDNASFFNVVTWEKLAQTCGQWLKKGKQVIVTGRLEQTKWQDKQTGQNRTAIHITANNVQFGSDNKQNNNGQSTQDGQMYQTYNHPPEQQQRPPQTQQNAPQGYPQKNYPQNVSVTGQSGEPIPFDDVANMDVPF